MKRSILFLLAAGLFFTLNCKRDLSYEKNRFTPPDIPTSAAPVTAALQGNVVDEHDQPVSGVRITVGSKTATTDSHGFFRIDGASLDKRASLLTGYKAGYFKIIKSFAATSGVNYQRIKLLRKDLAGKITASSGGTVSLHDGNSITLPAGGVVKESDNSSYTGDINVYEAVIDPAAADFPETIPGSLMADDKDGKRVLLRSYGMLVVELESPDGEPLQVAPGETATLAFSIPASLQSTAPPSIPLWYVDSAGLWKEQGRAYRSGNVYSGEVSHFSFWNCDSAFSTVMLNLILQDADKKPVPYTFVAIHGAEYGTAFGYTDSLGQVSGLVPFNQMLKCSLWSSSHCTAGSAPQSIGPFLQSVSLTMSVKDTSLVTVTGKILNCNNEPSAQGYALIYFRDNKLIAGVDPSGNFSIVLAKCGAEGTATIIGVDSAGRQQSATTDYDLSGTSVNTGDIKACGVSTKQFVNYTLDGTSYTLNDANHTTFSGIDTTGWGPDAETYFVFSAQCQDPENFIHFEVPADDPDNYSLSSLSFNIGQGYFGGTANNIPLKLTNVPSVVGEYFEGSFSGSFTDNGHVPSQTHQVSCTFRIRRTQ